MWTPVTLLLLATIAFAQHHDHQKMSKGDHMHRRFEDPAQWAKSFDDPARDQWQMPDRVLATLKIKPNHAVADIGAGTGYFSMRLAKSSAKVFAADIEATMVAYLQNRATDAGLKNVTAVQATADSANLPEPVDLIVLLNTYHHIPAREAYFRKLSASLKPGGRLAIIDWRPGAPMGPPDEFRFTPEKLAAELDKAGFRKVAQHDYLPNQNFLIFRAR